MDRQTHNTLAFHLSASLLPTSEHRTPGAINGSANYAPEESSNDRIRGRLGPTLSHPHQTEHVELRPLSGDLTVSRSQKAAKKQNQPTKASRLAHRVVSNLASLTYHHLSPHTQMQSRTHLKQNRARKPQKLSSLARVLGKVEADLSLDPSQASSETGLSDVFSGKSQNYGGGPSDGSGETMLNALHMRLGFLMPSVKPVRGPVSSRLKEWDGQNADRIASEGGLRQMESDLKTIERLLADHDHVQRDKGARMPQPALLKQVQQLKGEAEELRRKIKATTRALAQVEAQKQLESIPIEHLSDLVAAAQDSQQVLLGKNRWLRRKNGEFLRP
ncbi:hypothetical protein PHBOTO_002711 [Pseudozyma hubeiensis]|nr:hypothetical protein PHBOTO_002711 [Pseudozyma hubeiensis]